MARISAWKTLRFSWSLYGCLIIRLGQITQASVSSKILELSVKMASIASCLESESLSVYTSELVLEPLGLFWSIFVARGWGLDYLARGWGLDYRGMLVGRGLPQKSTGSIPVDFWGSAAVKSLSPLRFVLLAVADDCESLSKSNLKVTFVRVEVNFEQVALLIECIKSASPLLTDRTFILFSNGIYSNLVFREFVFDNVSKNHALQIYFLI